VSVGGKANAAIEYVSIAALSFGITAPVYSQSSKRRSDTRENSVAIESRPSIPAKVWRAQKVAG
jgi:hypothetical protein